MIHYKEIKCRAALNKHSGFGPYSFDLNIYRGCSHGCKYCFAMYSHYYLGGAGGGDYFEQIFVKTNIVQSLEAQLRNKNWGGHVINLGGITDSYQHAEAKYKFMPDILRLLIKYKNPCVISTKSVLILRDIDLWAQLAEKTYVNIAATITCADDALARKVEPGAAASSARFEMLEEFGKTKAGRGLHIMPVMPLITDTRENLKALYSRAARAGLRYVICDPLNLRGKNKGIFMNFVMKNFPSVYKNLLQLYANPTGSADAAYEEQLYTIIKETAKKYKMSARYDHPIKEALKNKKQLMLFDDNFI